MWTEGTEVLGVTGCKRPKGGYKKKVWKGAKRKHGDVRRVVD